MGEEKKFRLSYRPFSKLEWTDEDFTGLAEMRTRKDALHRQGYGVAMFQWCEREGLWLGIR